MYSGISPAAVDTAGQREQSRYNPVYNIMRRITSAENDIINFCLGILPKNRKSGVKYSNFEQKKTRPAVTVCILQRKMRYPALL